MRRLFPLFCAILLLYSCSKTLNPSVMFKTDKEYQYAQPDSALNAFRANINWLNMTNWNY
jgi:hypothetical protein